MRWPRRPQVGPDADPAASMALLEEVLEAPLGPGYHSAAQAREQAGLAPGSGTRTWLMFGTTVVLGVLVTVAALTLRAPDPAAAEGRAQLVERIEAAQEAGDGQREQVEQLRADIAELEQQVAAAQSPQAQAAIAEAAALAGAQPVQGPGLVLVLDDAPRSQREAPGEESTQERVNARDLQLVVNALWGAGAEAISVNGHRLTSTSAIRFAGEAIIVDFRGLAPPYEITAIGDPERLGQETSSGLVGAYLTELRQQLGLRADVTIADEVRIGPAERLNTRVAKVSVDPREVLQ